MPISMFKRTKKSRKPSGKKKHHYNVIDEPSVEKANESPDHVHHLDDFVEEGTFVQPQHTYVSNRDKYGLKDEETDEEIDNKTCEAGYIWVNVNDLM